MKKTIATLTLLATLTMSAINVHAETIITPEFTAEAVTNSTGMTNDYTYSFPTGSIVLSPSDALVMIGGQFIPTKAIIKDGCSFVPIRVVSDSFGETVEWLPETKEVSINNGDMLLKIDSTTSIVNGEIETLLHAPFIEDDTTYVPLRFVAENLDKEVGFIPKNDSIIKNDNPIVWIEEDEYMDNDVRPISDLEAIFKKMILENNKYLTPEGNAEEFTIEDIENTKYVNQFGRYALLDSTYPILIDATNDSAYIWYEGNGYSGITLLFRDDAHYDYDMGVSFDLPKYYEDYCIIGDTYTIDEGTGGVGFNVYQTASYNINDDLGRVFSIFRWDSEYTEENPPMKTGSSYELLRTDDYVYFVNFPSGVEAYKKDEAIYEQYIEITNYAKQNIEELKASIKEIKY